MKTCNVCGLTKSVDDFTRSSQNTGGYTHRCKSCELAYRRSYKGKLIGLYKTQRCNSKQRKHPEPNYSFSEFQIWAELHGYGDLHTAWVNSHYLKGKAPSADRLDDTLPYTLDNLCLTTWEANNDKAHKDFQTGKLFNKHTAIRQLTKSGECVGEFVSQLAASRATGIPQGNIGVVARKTGRRKTAGGFIWEFIP